jgi:hypothetical protein
MITSTATWLASPIEEALRIMPPRGIGIPSRTLHDVNKEAMGAPSGKA